MTRGDSTAKAQQPALENLRQSLEDYAHNATGEGFFDLELEKAKAAVRERALKLLDHRRRSREELRRRLIEAEFDAPLVSEVLGDLEDVGLIDDATFAEEWVRQRAQRRGLSTRVLDKELADKGISEPIRREALAQRSAEDEETMARVLAEKKSRSIHQIPQDHHEQMKALRRIVGVLARRGYAEGMSLSIAREVLDERIEELRTVP